jgi:hypothetical protein
MCAWLIARSGSAAITAWAPPNDNPAMAAP